MFNSKLSRSYHCPIFRRFAQIACTVVLILVGLCSNGRAGDSWIGTWKSERPDGGLTLEIEKTQDGLSANVKMDYMRIKARNAADSVQWSTKTGSYLKEMFGINGEATFSNGGTVSITNVKFNDRRDIIKISIKFDLHQRASFVDDHYFYQSKTRAIYVLNQELANLELENLLATLKSETYPGEVLKFKGKF